MIHAAHSSNPDLKSAIAELKSRLGGEARVVLFFASPVYPPAAIASAMQQAFPGSTTIGCTTAGELVSGRVLQNSVVAMSLGPEEIGALQVEVVRGAGSVAEERIMETLSDAPPPAYHAPGAEGRVKRRAVLQAGAAAAGLAARPAWVFVPAHNWDRFDWGTAPPVRDRLNQGPFPQYAPEEVLPGSEVVMGTTPSRDVVPGFGMGLVTYVTGDFGGRTFEGIDPVRAIEDFARLPLGQKLYVRPTWRELQKRPGRLEPDEYWKITFDTARRHGKRVGFRVMMSNPDIEESALPDFVLDKVPMVRLAGEWKGDPKHVRYRKVHQEPRYDHPAFQEAFRELNGLLAAELNGSPLVEYVDTFMYGFWGEGHTWPFTNNPFPDEATAERTWIGMFEAQLAHWTKTPLVTNTQPDFSRVGNSELVDRTIRSHNWLRTDTIFIENEQIEAIGSRPPWVAAVLEVGMSDGSPESLRVDEGVTYTDNAIAHVLDVGANYWSLWNWHKESARNVLTYYDQYPEMIDTAARRVGYRVRPSLVWRYEGAERSGLVIGFANDGIAGVPGVLRVTVASEDGTVKASGGLDPGYPLPGRIRQAQFPLPRGTDWKGLRLSAELEVKGVRYPVRWACRQKVEEDGSLVLRATRGLAT